MDGHPSSFLVPLDVNWAARAMERWGILDKLGFCSIPLAVNFILLSVVLEATSNPFWNEIIVISNQTVSLSLYSRKNCISSNIGLKIIGFNWKTVSSIPFSLNFKDTDYVSKTVSLKATKTSKINHQELLSLETRQCLTPGGYSYRGELCGDHVDLCLPRAGPHSCLGRPVLPGRWPLTKPSCEGLPGFCMAAALEGIWRSNAVPQPTKTAISLTVRAGSADSELGGALGA